MSSPRRSTRCFEGPGKLHRARALRLRGATPARWLDARLARIAGPGALVTLEDVSDQRRLREAAWGAEGLRESEATLRAILEAIPDVVFRHAPERHARRAPGRGRAFDARPRAA